MPEFEQQVAVPDAWKQIMNEMSNEVTPLLSLGRTCRYLYFITTEVLREIIVKEIELGKDLLQNPLSTRAIFIALMKRDAITTFIPKTEDKANRLEFRWQIWSSGNGIFLDGKQVIGMDHGTLSMWFVDSTETEVQASILERLATVWAFDAKFRSGERIYLTKQLCEFFHPILPSGEHYRFTRLTTVFRENVSNGDFDFDDALFGGKPKTMEMACDRPLVIVPYEESKAYFSKEYNFFVYPCHPTNPKTVEVKIF